MAGSTLRVLSVLSETDSLSKEGSCFTGSVAMRRSGALNVFLGDVLGEVVVARLKPVLAWAFFKLFLRRYSSIRSWMERTLFCSSSMVAIGMLSLQSSCCTVPIILLLLVQLVTNKIVRGGRLDLHLWTSLEVGEAFIRLCAVDHAGCGIDARRSGICR